MLPVGLGSGVGVPMAALMTLAMSGVLPNEARLASGLVNTSAQVGGALVVAAIVVAVVALDRAPRPTTHSIDASPAYSEC